MMTMISQYNPEYNAKPWLNTKSNPPLPTAGGQGAPITTLAIPENGGGTVTTLALGENGQGLPPIDYSLPKEFTGFGENGQGLPPVTTQAIPENGGGTVTTLALGENGQGLPPIDYSLPKEFTGFGENGQGLPPVTTQAIPENGGGTVTTLALGENGSGTPPRYQSISKHRYSNPTACHNIASPKKELMFKLWAYVAQFTRNSFNTSKTASVKDPFTTVLKPWTSNSPQTPIMDNPFWGA
jgi:hypothetical protein